MESPKDITDCQEWLDAGHYTSDVYTIYPMQYQNGLQVYCDMKTNGSRWMGLQGGWINAPIPTSNEATARARCDDTSRRLKATTQQVDGKTRQVDGRIRRNYTTAGHNVTTRRHETKEFLDLSRKLSWSETNSRTVDLFLKRIAIIHSDSLTTKHNNQDFSTYDRDNDNDAGNNCAEKHHGGWWFNKCQPTTGFNFNPDVTSNLNGEYSTVMGGSDNPANLRWKAVPNGETIFTSEIKLRKG
ncbi:fibrinogen C domain-containing protein 1-A-like [Acanthaster planci]|uniref:Fibrinogen C domain-containing protein 1-A-like n=1 Tax=Acanthaster planci TaxID=133434 RepID=A0A8B8A6J7_ACAPL|nr:fibrinogen C domain-containing protein 1-A-like [Acanthaster planci]